MNDESAAPPVATLLAYPWLLLFCLAVPLIVIAWRTRCYPTLGWTFPLALTIVASVVTVFVPAALTMTLVLDAVLIGVTAFDLYGLLRRSRTGLSAVRSVPATVSLGVPFRSVLTLENRGRFRVRGEFRDDVPDDFTTTRLIHPLDLRPNRRVTATTTLTPHRRGRAEMTRVDVRLFSPVGLWQRQRKFECEDRVAVYPDLKQLSDYALLARTDRLSQIGVRRTRRAGQDSNFERLRDYNRDDNFKHIDWRSTARRRKLTVRTFQSDQSQRIIFLLDCGRMMTNTAAGYSLLDHSLNAMLMMSYVALQRGDSVGLMCFSDRIESYLPPRGGGSQMNRLIQAGYDRFPRLVESRYDTAFQHLANRCKRRSLVVLITNVLDAVNAEAVRTHLVAAGKTHLPLAVLLRDESLWAAVREAEPLLATATAGPPRGPQQHAVLRGGVAADLLVWRHRLLNDLRHRGALIVDTSPEELTAPLVNEYLKVKASHRL